MKCRDCGREMHKLGNNMFYCTNAECPGIAKRKKAKAKREAKLATKIKSMTAAEREYFERHYRY